MSRASRRWQWLGAALALLGFAGVAFLVSEILADPTSRRIDSRRATDSREGASSGRTANEADGAGTDGHRSADSDSHSVPAGNGDNADDGANPGGAGLAPDDPPAVGGSFESPDPDLQPDSGSASGTDDMGGNPDDPTIDDLEESRPRRPAMLRSARDPTPRERLERRRYRNGRRLPQADDFPESAGGDDDTTEDSEAPATIDMARIAEPEVWTEYWSSLGIEPPDMVATPIRGKLINRENHRGLSAAVVRLFTFFPATSRLDGPLLPLAVVTQTDAAGFFEFIMPVPGAFPAGYPKLGLAVEAGGRRLIDGLVLNVLRAGEPNEIGVLWVPEEPHAVDAVLSVVQPGLAVVSTGRLDPLRWDERRAAATLAHFIATPAVGLRTQTRGTWDPLGDSPFLTLTRDGRPLITRQCVTAPEDTEEPAPEDSEDEKQAEGEIPIGQPFEPVVFPNDGTFSLAGTVTDTDQNVVEGAVLTLTVKGEERVAWSDGYGWFHFGSLPDQPVTVSVTHEDFVDEVFVDLLPGTADFNLQMRFRRPDLTFRVKHSSTGEPARVVWFRLVPITNPGDEQLELGEEIISRHESEDGVYRIEHNLPLHSLHLEAFGTEPVALPTDSTDPVDVWLQPAGLDLQRAPRNWDAVQNANGWRMDTGNPDEPWIWSLDDDHWVDYIFDFGTGTGAPGSEGVGEQFVLELGVRNHSYNTLPLDNEFTFEVDVLVDNVKVGTLSIPSDALVPRYARLPLGKLSGPHTVRLLWTNDRYIPGQLDANIRYESLQIMRAAGD